MTLWQPTASIANLKERARILAKVRDFFAIRNVIEVDTPALSRAATTDPHLNSLSSECLLPGNSIPTPLYLQTSPEYAMKRLLAAGMGPIYQICKSFRAEESGKLHNPEFTMLEWYRPGFTHYDLMIEVDGLMRQILACEVAECKSYGDLFQHYCNVNPYETSIAELREVAANLNLTIYDAEALTDLTAWLQLIMAEAIEPHLGQNNSPTFVIDFPAAQAALAKINPGPPAVAERFELYWQGMELANGFHELCDAKEQLRRFEADNSWRIAHDLAPMPIDHCLIAALEHGMPNCAGVALGVDRLVMAALRLKNIKEVIAFPVERA